MFHHIILTVALAFGGMEADSLARSYDSAQPRQARFGVEFRQPEWREHAFHSSQEMDDFIADKTRNGWELQIHAPELRVSYRLMQWGGSRIFDTLPEAEAWARYLDQQVGYQVRIVDHP